MQEIEADLQLLIDAAYASGEIAKKYFEKQPNTWEKSDNAGPVTEADLEVDRMLMGELLAARPDYGWLSEESETQSDRLKKERVFIVDPIDGTRAFIAGEKTFAHSLAIAESGVVYAAAVYLPLLDRLYVASSKTASTCNGSPIFVSDSVFSNDTTVLAAKPNLRPEFWRNGDPPEFKRHFRPSLAYRLCLVSDGAFDAMITLRKCWEWDIAAGSLIVQQAGGVPTGRLGEELRFNQPSAKTSGCLAANSGIHRRILSKLN